MSEMYFTDNTLQELNERETVPMTKGHQVRSCAVCGDPIIDEKAESLPIGGGLSLKIHRACMNDLVDAMQPVAVTLPVPVAKPVTRKATVATPTSDKDRLKERIRFEFAKLLMQHGFIQ